MLSVGLLSFVGRWVLSFRGLVLCRAGYTLGFYVNTASSSWIRCSCHTDIVILSFRWPSSSSMTAFPWCYTVHISHWRQTNATISLILSFVLTHHLVQLQQCVVQFVVWQSVGLQFSQEKPAVLEISLVNLGVIFRKNLKKTATIKWKH